MINERRSASRVQCELPSSFRDFDSVTSWSSCFAAIKDISRGGMRLRTHATIHMNDRLGISFKLPGQDRTLEARVSPAWMSRIANTEIYDLGVRFLEVSDEDKAAIEKFC